MAAKGERLLWHFKNDVLLLIRQLLKMFSEAPFFCAAFWWRQTPINTSFLCTEKHVFPHFCLK